MVNRKTSRGLVDGLCNICQMYQQTRKNNETSVDELTEEYGPVLYVFFVLFAYGLAIIALVFVTFRQEDDPHEVHSAILADIRKHRRDWVLPLSQTVNKSVHKLGSPKSLSHKVQNFFSKQQPERLPNRHYHYVVFVLLFWYFDLLLFLFYLQMDTLRRSYPTTPALTDFVATRSDNSTHTIRNFLTTMSTDTIYGDSLGAGSCGLDICSKTMVEPKKSLSTIATETEM